MEGCFFHDIEGSLCEGPPSNGYCRRHKREAIQRADWEPRYIKNQNSGAPFQAVKRTAFQQRLLDTVQAVQGG